MKAVGKHLLVLSLALLFVCAAPLIWWTASGNSLIAGRYLQGENGAGILISSSGPIVLRDRSKPGNLFDGLKTGDRVLVACDGVAESFPSQAGAHWCLHLGDGGPQDLPQDTLTQLADLGWITLPV